MEGHTSDLIGQRNERLSKVAKLREIGIDPYPSKSNRTHKISEPIENYSELEGKEVTLSGRLLSWREHGKLVFGNIQDQTGKIQVYIKETELKALNVKSQTLGWDELKLLDIGDIIETTGAVTKTQRGEISILASTIKILTKAIRPLPDKWKGLQDKEKIYRQRYLDMIMNPDHRWRFEKTAEITFAIREFLYGKGFLEIKTPIVQPLYGGGLAKPFTTHVNALNTDYFLAISHELYLKRLIAAGFENVFNIVGYFRNEGIDRTHNPEFTMLETMSAFQNYEYNMELTEEMFRYIGQKVFGKTVFTINGQQVDFGKKWERIMMIDAVKKYTGYDFNEVKTLDEAHKILIKEGLEERPTSIGESMVMVFKYRVEEHLVQPTFVHGHPVEISPLAKAMSSDRRFVERFEIFIGGIEAGDNWTELNDPIELFSRFKEQIDRRVAGDEEAHPMDIDFIEAIEHGMPPTTGLGPGIERLAMMLTDTEYMDDVVFFPMLKPAEITDTQKEIYGEEYLMGKKSENEEVDNSSKAKRQDFTKRMVVVVNEEVTGWQLTNTIGHIGAYLGNKIKQGDFSSTDSFETADGEILPSNSQYPVVTVVAKPGQMLNLYEKVKISGLEYIVYVQDMIDFNEDGKLAESLKGKKKDEVRICGIGLFGDNEKIKELTKKFSLYK